MDRFIDIHCHILPAVDDGARCLEQAVEMLKIAHEDGIGTIIATPHYHIGRCVADNDKCNEAMEDLDKYISLNGLDIKLYRGTEVYFFSEAMEKIVAGEIETMNKGRCILMEFDPGTQYARILQAINEAAIAGYVPIVAHIERYMCILEKPDRCEEIVKLGALIQVNASSVVGKGGKDVQKFIKKLMKKRFVSFVATDAHSDGHRRPVLSEAYKFVSKKFGLDYAADVFYNNPLKVINNKY